MKKRIAVIVAAVAMSVLMAIPAYAGTWKDVGGRWKYQRSANKYASQGWLNLDGKKYYIGSDGFMVTGWTKIDGQWYFMDESGLLQYGWLKDNEKWYYLAPGSGAMMVNTVIEGRQIGEDGVWIPAEAQTEPVSSSVDLSTAYLMQNMTEGQKSKGFTVIAEGKTSNQQKWTNAGRMVGSGSFLRCDTNGGYKILSGTYSPSTKFDRDLLGKVTVYGDNDQVLYTSPDIHYNENPYTFAVDVSGQNQVRVEFTLTKDDNWSQPVILFDNLALYQ